MFVLFDGVELPLSELFLEEEREISHVPVIDLHLADGLRILYGGWVKPDNASELMSVANVDGALVGGASLKAADFLAICEVYRKL